MFVGQPFARGAVVVQMQHGGHRIDPQTIDVKFLHPIQGVRHQEVAHLMPRVIEDERAPAFVLTASAVFVFVESRTIETGQRMFVLGKMRGHPIENDADAGQMTAIHEALEGFRTAMARRGRVIASHLVTPTAIERVFGHAHQFHMGEALLGNIGNQLRGQCIPVEEAAIRMATPSAWMHLVDGYRFTTGPLRRPTGKPTRVMPIERLLVSDHAAVRRTAFRSTGHRVGF